VVSGSAGGKGGGTWSTATASTAPGAGLPEAGKILVPIAAVCARGGETWLSSVLRNRLAGDVHGMVGKPSERDLLIWVNADFIRLRRCWKPRVQIGRAVNQFPKPAAVASSS
jgi:hypothetical protein